MASGLVIAVITMAITLRQPRSFTAHSSFMPESRRGNNPLSGVAAQFGLSVRSGDAMQAPTFYADLLHTRDLLRAAVTTRYVDPALKDSATRLDMIYDLGARDASERLDAAIGRLDASIITFTTPKTGVVRLAVSAPSPALAVAVNDTLLALVSRFNNVTRQSQAKAERRFAEQRAAEVAAELRNAENELQEFLLRNRIYHSAPGLSFSEDRLSREVSRLQQIYTMLQQSFEQARLDEIREIPVLTVLEHAEPPLRPDPRGTVTRTVSAGVLGVLLALAIILAGIGLAELRSAASGGSRLARVIIEAIDDLRHPFRTVRGRQATEHTGV